MARKRRPKTFHREPKHFRPIVLLSTGQQARIDPSQYRAHTNAKSFDDKTTQILRVHRYVPSAGPSGSGGSTEDDPSTHFLVYGMNAENNGKKVVSKIEAWEMVIDETQIPSALDAIANHCGIAELRTTL